MAAVLTLTLIAISNTATAQWGPFGRNCNCQPAIAPYAAGPAFSQTAMANPCITQSVAVAQIPCVQPVQETVYRDVPVTEYRKETRTVKKPVIKTVYEDRKVTAYRQILVDKTAEVPSVNYQTITEQRPVTVNRSYWRNVRQPVAKGIGCDYDRRPSLAGWFNRSSYDLRMAFTPSYINRREFVPNVVAYNVPTQRTVAIPTTRQVAYKVSQIEPYTTTQRVARNITEYVEEQVTVHVPHTTTKTVAVGTRTRMAYVNPYGGGGTATASRPTPDRTAEANAARRKRTSTNTDGGVRQQSFEQPVQQRAPDRPAEPAPFGFEHGRVEPEPSETDADVAGWRPSRHRRSTHNGTAGPSLPIVAAN